MPAKTDVAFVCPHDGQTLKANKNQAFYNCSQCQRRYPAQDGVIRFLDKPDDFYEGSFRNQIRFLPHSEHWYAAWPLWLLNNGYVWQVRRHLPAGGIVLELGCASGIAYFGQRYTVLGLDVSHSSLVDAARLYQYALQADAFRIPLPDKSVDGVLSSYFWEHIPPSKKPELLAEIYRVLRPAGKLVFLYDVETENPLIRRYKKKDPALYRQLFIEGDGHLGYQTSHENLRLFREGGFSVLAHHGMEKTWLQSASVYTKLAGYGGKMGGVYKWLQNMLGKRLLFYPYTAVLRMIDTIICPFLPGNWARIELVVCEKEIK